MILFDFSSEARSMVSDVNYDTVSSLNITFCCSRDARFCVSTEQTKRASVAYCFIELTLFT